MYRVLIVDDETPARQRMVKAVQSVANVQIVGEAASGTGAVDALLAHHPDIVLLDVEMPHGDGFHVVEEGMKHGLAPEVIFVTAYDKFAIDAFEYGAIDYLLKPAEIPRVQVAIQRAIERLQQRSAQDRATKLQSLIDARNAKTEQRGDHSVQEDLWLKERGVSRRVPLESILYIEADRDYVRIGTAEQSFHIRGTIVQYEKHLETKGFVRIHRSLIVRQEAVTGLCYKGQNAFEVEVSHNHHFPVGRSYNSLVRRLFGPLEKKKICHQSSE